jgi:hypothetical protein
MKAWRASPHVADGDVLGQGAIQEAPELSRAGCPLGFQVEVGNLPEGVDPRIRPTGAPQVQQMETGFVEDVFDAPGHGADTLAGLPGALLLPALELAAVVFDEQPVGGEGCSFRTHDQTPMTVFTASISVAGSWMGLAI